MTRSRCFVFTSFLVAVFLAAVLLPGTGRAMPSFSRQTNMSCNQCHTSFGGPVPNFTMTGKKFRAFGYRTPHVRERIVSGEEGALGERLDMPLLNYLSFRFQAQLATSTKSPGAKDWSEVAMNPTTRLAWFFTGPVSDNIGVWDEFYFIPEGSRNREWTLGLGSWDELDLRYVFNPDNTETAIGVSLNNQGLEEIMGFGPFPVFIGGGYQRGSVNGYAHPNTGYLVLYGWMHNRWVWQVGYNTGDTNVGLDRINGVGQIGVALKNSDANELWLNVLARNGSDVMPLVSSNFVAVDGRDWSYRDAVDGVTATRPGGAGPYLAADVHKSTSLVGELRWSRQDIGSHSYEAVARYAFNTEDYKDDAKTKLSTIGAEVRYGFRHTYYVDPFIMSTATYEFTDHTGKVHKIDTPVSYGVNLGFKPAENFLINMQANIVSTLHLDQDATTGGKQLQLYMDYCF